jgi:hypothetical protein
MKVIWIFAILLILIGCAGKEVNKIDTTPPLKPVLFSHRGDTGEIISGDTLNYYKKEFGVYGWDDLQFENNGIDAVAVTGNHIQIQWRPLADTDLSHVNIYRFNAIDNDTLKIGQTLPGNNRFEDMFTNFVGSTVGIEWFYYIDVFDEAGNHTVSDTVCYQLLDKPQLTGPDDEASVSSAQDIIFRWIKSELTDILYYRLLVFDEDRNILWVHIPTDNVVGNEFEIAYNGLNITGSKIIWRVDAFGDAKVLVINGTLFEIPVGSESEERILNLAK